MSWTDSFGNTLDLLGILFFLFFYSVFLFFFCLVSDLFGLSCSWRWSGSGTGGSCLSASHLMASLIPDAVQSTEGIIHADFSAMI